jgi:hypothetical protein
MSEYSLSQYFRLLGLPSDASPDTIHRAYRRKAKQLHPDVNPSPDAHAEFLKIREAYEVLAGIKNIKAEPVPPGFKAYPKYSPRANDPGYAERAKRYREWKKKEAQKEDSLNSLRPIMVIAARFAAVISLSFCTLLFTDYVLPLKSFPDSVKEADLEQLNMRSISLVNRLVSTQTTRFPAKEDLFYRLYPEAEIILLKTPIFNLIRKIEFEKNRYQVAYGILDNFIMFPVALWFIGFFGIINWKNKDELIINLFFNIALMAIVAYLF